MPSFSKPLAFAAVVGYAHAQSVSIEAACSARKIGDAAGGAAASAANTVYNEWFNNGVEALCESSVSKDDPNCKVPTDCTAPSDFARNLCDGKQGCTEDLTLPSLPTQLVENGLATVEDINDFNTKAQKY